MYIKKTKAGTSLFHAGKFIYASTDITKFKTFLYWWKKEKGIK